jgi:hypothetical protein
MKSGNTSVIEFRANVNLKDFEKMHGDRNCAGQWQITITIGPTVRFAIDALGPVHVPWIPLATCHTCKTSYELPKFRHFIEHTIARHLVTDKGLLTKRQIRFLRLFFNQTQEEFAPRIGVANKHEMSKIESEESERTLDPDRQVRLRLYCAKLLKIGEPGAIYGVNEIDDSHVVKIPVELFPSEKEAEKVINELEKTG